MQTLLLQTPHGKINADINSIIRIESKSNYSKLVFVDNKYLVVAKVLSWFDNVLCNDSFLRTHRSHLVNKKYIQSNNKKELCLSNGDTIQISRRKRRLFSI